MYTLSMMRTATKAGGKPPRIPPSAPFPLPYLDETAAGSQWEVHGSDGVAGPIALRSDASLCLATRKPALEEDSGSNLNKEVKSSSSFLQRSSLCMGRKAHAASIAISGGGEWAAWSSAGPGKPGCDGVALATGGSDTHWMRLESGALNGASGADRASGAAVFADIG